MAKESKSALELNMLTEAQRKSLQDGINKLVVQKDYIKTLSDGFKEDAKALSDELGIPVSELNSAVSAVVNQNFFESVKKQDNVETILTISGLLAKASDDE